jgi:hypothetical protein
VLLGLLPALLAAALVGRLLLLDLALFWVGFLDADAGALEGGAVEFLLDLVRLHGGQGHIAEVLLREGGDVVVGDVAGQGQLLGREVGREKVRAQGRDV